MRIATPADEEEIGKRNPDLHQQAFFKWPQKPIRIYLAQNDYCLQM